MKPRTIFSIVAALFLAVVLITTCTKDESLTTGKDEAVTEVAFRHDASQPASAAERAALVTFYHKLATTGTLFWPVDDPASDPCRDSWMGVICQQGRIIALDLDSRQLSVVTDIGALPNLETLDLASNGLRSIPDFQSLPALKALLLPYNQLRAIPDFTHLPNLQLLNLRGNRLSALPDFSNLGNLRTLYLYGNQLQTLPDFSQLPELVTLEVLYNELAEVPDFSHLPRLERLDLTHNRLKSVPDFQHLANLKTLVLSHNQLRNVPNFHYLPKLEYLEIQFSRLSFVPSFADLPLLDHLELEGNQFICYQPGLETHCGRLSYVDLNAIHYPHLPEWDDFCATGAGTCTGNPADPSELWVYFLMAMDNGDLTVDQESFTDAIWQADAYYRQGNIPASCTELQWLEERCDGAPRPYDLIRGPEVEAFHQHLSSVLGNLDCLP